MSSKLLTQDDCRTFIEKQLFEPDPSRTTGKIGSIGIELEAFPYTIAADKCVRPVQLNGGRGSLSNALIRVVRDSGGAVKYLNHDSQFEANESHLAKIEFPDGTSFQFEPGGQVEIATAPCDSMDEVSTQLKSKQDILSAVTQNDNIHFGQFGTNPWFDVHEIGLQMKKARFRALSQYFDRINPFGRQMMVQTASLQVNLDLGQDSTTRIRRIVASNLLVPFATALFANSSIIEGRVNGRKSYRSYIWQHLDATRTGILPMDRVSKTFSKEDLIDDYLQFALKAPLIYIEDFGDQVFPAPFNLEYWLAHPIEGLTPTTAHLRNHLSLLFPEVRLKGYLELRSVDAPPSQWQMVPAIFYTGLLYSNQELDKTLDMLLPFASQLPLLLEKATFGMATDEIFDTAKSLMQLAIEGFSGLPNFFKSDRDTDIIISFFERFTLRRKTFADEYLDAFLIAH